MSQGIPSDRAPAERAPGTQAGYAEHELLTTLFDLGRQVTSVLDLDELLHQIPRLIGRLISFEAFAVYLLDERRGELRAAYSVGYPETGKPLRLKLGAGLVGAAVASEHPLLVNDLRADSRYIEFVPGMNSEIVVPLLHIAADGLVSKPDTLKRSREELLAIIRRGGDGLSIPDPLAWQREQRDDSDLPFHALGNAAAE